SALGDAEGWRRRHLSISPPEGEMPGRAEGGEPARSIGSNLCHPRSRHTSAFTRAVPPRGMLQSLSRSFRFRMRDRPGHDIVPRYMAACAAGKTRRRAPFGGFFRATPVLLRHRAARAAPVLGPVGIRCVPRLPRPLSDTIAGCRRKTAAHVRRGHQSRTPLGPPTRHARARTFFSPEENHFPHGFRHGASRRLPMPAHRLRLALAPQGVADAERGGVWHRNGGLERDLRIIFLICETTV